MSRSNTAAGEQCGRSWGDKNDVCPDNRHIRVSRHVCRCVIIFTMEEYSRILRTGVKNYLKEMAKAKEARHRDHECSCGAKP